MIVIKLPDRLVVAVRVCVSVVSNPGSVDAGSVRVWISVEPGICWVTVTTSPGSVDIVVDVRVNVARLPETLVVLV